MGSPYGLLLASVVSGIGSARCGSGPRFGILNAGLAWLSQPKWLFSEDGPSRPHPDVTLGRGGSMMIFLAGLRGVPQNSTGRFPGRSGRRGPVRAITLPLMTPTLFFTLVTGIIGSFQVFTAAYIMTSGGPNNATLMYVLNLYNQAFMKYHFGYASGLAWILLFIILALTLLVFKSSALWVYYEAEVKAGR